MPSPDVRDLAVRKDCVADFSNLPCAPAGSVFTYGSNGTVNIQTPSNGTFSVFPGDAYNWNGSGFGWGSNWTTNIPTAGHFSGSKWITASWSGSKWLGSKWLGSKWVGSKWMSSGWSSVGPR
jgi:hypothetical protein